MQQLPAFSFTLMVALVALLPAGPADPSATEAAASPCPGFQHVPGQGPSCPVPGGWEVLLDDGSRQFTHGGDPVPPRHLLEARPPVPDASGSHGEGGGHTDPIGLPEGPVCVDDPLVDHHARLIYAVRWDGSFSDHKAERVRQMAIEADQVFDAAAAEWGHDIHLKVRCDDTGQPDVARVRLDPAAGDGLDFSAVVNALKRQGHALPHVHYWVWFDGYHPQWGGFGHGQGQQSASLSNHANTGGPLYALTWGYDSWWIMLHELAHNMGAVSHTAPHTTGGLHCNDGHDVMCYDDGGPSADFFVRCASWRFDCGNDDYFHPKPPPGNYLFDHWNLASPLNRFVHVTDGCEPIEGILSLPADGVVPAGDDLARVHHQLPPSCGGRFYILDGAPLRSMHACWYQADGSAECHHGGVSVWNTVPEGATRVEIWTDGATGGAFRLMVN